MGNITYFTIIINSLLFSFIFWLLTFLCKYFYQDKYSNYKLNFYECGFKSISAIRLNISVQYFLIGIFLIIYDGEFLILFPLLFNTFSISSLNFFLFFFFFLFYIFNTIYWLCILCPWLKYLIFLYPINKETTNTILKFFEKYADNNQLNIFFFNELNLVNFFNFKNLFLNYNSNIFSLFSIINNNLLFNWYNIELNKEDIFYNSLILDYYNYLNNIYYLCFNFNNNINLEQLFNNYYLNAFYNLNFSYKLLSINFFKNQIISYNSWFLLIFYFILFYFVLIWFYLLFNNKINILFKNEKIYDEYNTVINYLVESEKELGSLDDMFIGVSILICVYGWFFFGTIFFNFFSNLSFSYIYIGFPLFLFIILGMPSNMLWNYGILYPIYLRGSSNTTILILEFMYDVLATGIMYIRLIVQNVRFILMFFAFFECYEFFLNSTFIIKNYYFFNFNYSIINSFYNFFLLLINFFIFYVYNIGHLIYTIISHFFAYLVLVFWFFSFLYTTFLEEKLELYFKVKNK